MTNKKRLALAVLTGVTLVFGSAQAASAAGGAVYDTQSTDGGALVQFRSYGDDIMIDDVHCDGRVPRVEWKFGIDYGFLLYEDHHGCSSGWLNAAPNLDMQEGADIWVRACNVDADGSRCGAWKHGTA
jgi:hypothetical protein